jgi:hypothetical protein
MRIDKFIEKWGPIDPEADEQFQNDLFSTITGSEYQNIAIEVLSEVPDSQLKIADGVLSYAPIVAPHLGIEIHYSKAVGLQQNDWEYLLKFVASFYIKNSLQ